MYRPRVDPCIFLHYDAGDWVTLLGEDLVRELLRRFRHVAADVDGLVRYAAENPEAFQLGLRGLRVGGRFGREWVLYVEGGFVEPRWRARWPPVADSGEVNVRLQVSPCYLLTVLSDGGRRYIWRSRAPSLFKWVSAVPRSRPLEVFRSAFPLWLRELAWARGYSWVAWSRWRDRRNRHLAEWLYWLDTGRMAHIDMALGRYRDVYEKAGRTNHGAAEVLYESS